MEMSGTVKRFKQGPGFGFLVLDTPYQNKTGGKEVFIHVMMLKRSGLKKVSEGDKLIFDSADLIEVEKGWELKKIISHTPAIPVQPRTAPRTLPISAKVKNYNDIEGYGFLKPFNGDPELFFHSSILTGTKTPEIGDEFLITGFAPGTNGKRDVVTALRPLFD